MMRRRCMLAGALVMTVTVPCAGAQGAVSVVTSDLANFYRAFDAARGRDSAERVAIFEREYIRAGSPGLKDWALVRLASWDESLIPALTVRGWTMPRIMSAYQAAPTDSARRTLMGVLDTIVPPTAAANIAAVTARAPRYFESVRARVLALDTSSAIKQAAARGLQRLGELVPGRTPKPVYIVMGRFTSGGTIGPSGVLLGAEMATRAAETPVDELSETERGMVSDRAIDAWSAIIVHEAVHTMQPPSQRASLLAAVLGEGVPDFLASLALPEVNIAAGGHHAYGRANEARIKREFVLALRRREDAGRWMYNYGNPRNHGHPDLGYFVGERIAAAYYARATDKAAALRELVELRDPERILRESGYLRPVTTTRRR
jgi:hypothetical protein